ncbi:MAG TPA: hypothetical protein VGK02_11710 [Candidatus Aquicultor sp.]|jgi:hypothetical protein
MNQEDRREFMNLFSEGFERLVIPAIAGLRKQRWLALPAISLAS